MCVTAGKIKKIVKKMSVTAGKTAGIKVAITGTRVSATMAVGKAAAPGKAVYTAPEAKGRTAGIVRKAAAGDVVNFKSAPNLAGLCVTNLRGLGRC